MGASTPSLLTGHRSDEPFEKGLDSILPMGGYLMTIFHTTIDATTVTFPVLQEKWSGPIAVYPDANQRGGYVSQRQDPNIVNRESPEAFLKVALDWVGQGVQGHRRLLRLQLRVYSALARRPAEPCSDA